MKMRWCAAAVTCVESESVKKNMAVEGTATPATGGMRMAVRWGLPAGLAVGALFAAFAFSKAQPLSSDDMQVLAADTALGEAMRLGDKATVRRHLALQFSLVDSDGRIFARKDFLADLKGVAAAAAASDVKVRGYGLLALVTGRHKSARAGNVFFLDVWVRQKGTWRALLMQEVAIAAEQALPAAPALAAAPAAADPPYECKNPCQTIPYRVRSPAEQQVLGTFQAIMKAVIAHDAKDWGKRVADEFVVYASGRAPVPKSDRVAAIERQKDSRAAVTVAAVETMRLAVYGDGALMVATAARPDEAGPRYRTARVWVRRDGQWLMAISADTDIK
jgi:hypothetical protein